MNTYALRQLIFALIGSVMLIALTIPLMIALWAVVAMSVLHYRLGSIPFALFVVPVAFAVSITAHELGHLVVARAVGFRILSVKVWPIVFETVRERVRIRCDWAIFRVPLGFVFALPRKWDYFRLRFAAFAFGGPAANLLLFSCAAAAIVWLATSAELEQWRSAMIWLGLFAASNWFCFLGLVPIIQFGYPSDGAIIMDQVLGGQRAEQQHLGLVLMAESRLAGVRPRDWDSKAIERLLALRDGTSNDFAGNTLGFYHALDRGQMDAAGELLDRVLNHLRMQTATTREALTLEAAFFEARYRCRTQEARRLFETTTGLAGVDVCARRRAEAAVLWAEQRFIEAADAARAGIAALPDSPDPGGATAERDWLESILVDCEAAVREKPH